MSVTWLVVGVCAAVAAPWMLLQLIGDVPIAGYARVHDGDTIYVNDQAVRLWGVDAEELSETHGHEAHMALVAITIQGGKVACEPIGKSYDRVVAVCISGGMDIGAELIRRGYALDCERYSGGRYRHLEPPGARERLRQKPYCGVRP